MIVHLHCGAHKTATTYIQSVLTANVLRLNRAGVGYRPLKELRRELSRNLERLTPATFDSAGFSSRFFREAAGNPIAGLLMSDENIVGTCGAFFRTGQLYGNVEARLRLLRDLLPGHQFKLFFAVRSYDTFIASAYCEALRASDAFFSFDAARQKLDLEGVRWPALLSRMVEALEPLEVTIWRYEDFSANSTSIIRKLAFNEEISLEHVEAAERASFSATAIEVIELIASRFGDGMAGQLKGPIVQQLPKGPLHPAFDPWKEPERQRLREWYEEDCLRLPGEFLRFQPISAGAAA